MTSKLKCPVCNHKLYQTASEPATYCCLYKDCPSDFKFAGSKEIWQSLIQAKQDLEIVRKALNLVANGRGDGQAIMREYEKGKFIGVREICRNALKQIEHIADISKMI